MMAEPMNRAPMRRRFVKTELVRGWYYRTERGFVYECIAAKDGIYTMRHRSGETFQVRNPRRKGAVYRWDIYMPGLTE